MCLTKYVEGYVRPWKKILSVFFLNVYGDQFLLHWNFSVADLPSCFPNFYRQCFEVWCNLSVKPVLFREQASNQPLWNNPFLCIDGKPVFNKTLFSKGLISLANILTNTRSLKPWTSCRVEALNVNDYLGLSLPLTWKKLFNSKDQTTLIPSWISEYLSKLHSLSK